MPNDERPTSSSRRSFLGAGLAAGVVVAAEGCVRVRVGESRDEVQPDAGAAKAVAPAIPSFELEGLGVEQLQQGMASGRWTARRLVELYHDRIAAVDRGGPRINQVLELNPDAIAIAEGLDAERRAGRVRGPLHGIPVLIKDNIATTDRMETTAGSLALLGARPPREAFIVARLRAAGAVILGKTNLSEWANFRSNRSSSGWSGRGGQTRNPYALDRSPSGSSSGSGGAAAASLAALAIGTETDGSIVSPASSSGVVGFKPTVGLVSRAMIIPIAHSQDTAGPMTRTVADAAALLGAIAGVDPDDPATEAARQHVHADYTRFLDPRGLRGARIGVVRERHMGASRKADAIVEDAIALLKAEGAEIIDPANIVTSGQWGGAEYEVLLYEFKADLDAYLGKLGPEALVHSLADVIAFNEKHADREMPFFGQEILLQSQAKGPLTEKAYLEALERCRRLSRAEGIDATMDKHRLDALIAPTTGPAKLIDLVNGDAGGGGSFAGPAAVSGYPHVTVPAGYAHGMPVGLSFVGRAWSEPVLLRLAYAFERAARVWQAPRFLPTADLSAPAKRAGG
jgi:amidase